MWVQACANEHPSFVGAPAAAGMQALSVAVLVAAAAYTSGFVLAYVKGEYEQGSQRAVPAFMSCLAASRCAMLVPTICWQHGRVAAFFAGQDLCAFAS